MTTEYNIVERKEMVKVLFKDLTIIDAEATFKEMYCDGELIDTSVKCVHFMNIIGQYECNCDEYEIESVEELKESLEQTEEQSS